MFSGVIRAKVQLSVNALTGWITRSWNKPHNQQLELQFVIRNRIPEVTYNYCEFHEPLLGQDY